MVSTDDARALLHRYGGDSAWIRHCKAVSCVAARVGALMTPKYELDVVYLTKSALLSETKPDIFLSESLPNYPGLQRSRIWT